MKEEETAWGRQKPIMDRELSANYLDKNKSGMSVQCCSLSIYQGKSSWRVLDTDRGNNMDPVYLYSSRKETNRALSPRSICLT